MPHQLVSDLRRFVLSYGEHDEDCDGFDAVGPSAVEPAVCSCGFITRLEALLTAVEDELRSS